MNHDNNNKKTTCQGYEDSSGVVIHHMHLSLVDEYWHILGENEQLQY